MQIEVGKNTKRNILYGVLNRMVLLVLPFVMRSIINITLGAEYLGLNSLFSSILTVLSLTEMGISSALVYHMYKPIAEGDTSLLCALLNFYKKAYRTIGTVILIAGCVLIPFLPSLIKGGCPDDVNLTTIYLIQLLSTSISYFINGYKQALLVAYQRDDVNSILNLFVQLGMQIIQVLILLLTHNYYLYTICLPVFTVINNIWIGIITNKLFPEIRCHGKLESETLENIKKLVIGTFIQKACGVTRNALDSICISAFIGLTLNGMYNNYYTIFNGVTVALSIISNSLSGGIGNHVAIKSVDENFAELKQLDFLYLSISGWCTICLLCLSQPFMSLWMGKNMLLDLRSVVLMSGYFYLLKMGDMRSIYNAANGLWWKMKYRSIIETLMNIVLNIVLGYYYGIHGIIGATMISLFLCNFLWGSSILFEDYFGKAKLKSYYCYQSIYAVFVILFCFITYILCSLINIDGFTKLFVNGVICVIVPGVFFLLFVTKSKIYKNSLNMVKGGKNG